MAKTDLKFYLTGQEPNITQPLASQSLGGYPSLSEYSINALLSEAMDSQIQTTIINNDIGSPIGILIDDELMIVEQNSVFGPYGDEMISVQRGQFSTKADFHIPGDTVYVQNKNNLFNGSLSIAGTQFRCIAIKNTGVGTFYNVKIYIKYGSQNPGSNINIALEIPIDNVYYGSASSSTTITITDSAIANLYPDNVFVGRVLVVDDPLSVDYNLARQVASYDGTTGTFTFINSMAFPLESNATFRVEQSPSQIITSGRISPIFSTNYVSSQTAALGIANAISLNFSGTRGNGTSLLPNEVIYIWFERDVSTNTDIYTNNSIVFTINYRDSI